MHVDQNRSHKIEPLSACQPIAFQIAFLLGAIMQDIQSK